MYFDSTAQTDFKDRNNLDELNKLFNAPRYPFISLGSHKGYAYRLVPT